MAAQIHCNRKPCDVRRKHFDIHSERRHPATEPLRTDAELVDAIEELGFELPKIRTRMPHIDRAEHGFLREQCRGLERPADTDHCAAFRSRDAAGAPASDGSGS